MALRSDPLDQDLGPQVALASDRAVCAITTIAATTAAPISTVSH
jgi:hypothetical protein